MKLSEIIAAWENGETIQYRDSNSKLWLDVTSYDTWCEWQIKYHHLPFISGTEYRIKPRTLSANGIKFPAPINNELELETVYYLVDLTAINPIREFGWSDDRFDKLWLKRGLIHLSKDDAYKQAEAMLSLLKPKG